MSSLYRRFEIWRIVAVLAGLSLIVAACGDEPQIAEATATGVDDADTELGSALAEPSEDGSEIEQPDGATVGASGGTGTVHEGTSPLIEGPGEIATDGSASGELADTGGRHTYRMEVIEGQEIVMVQLGGCQFSGGELLQAEIDGGGVSNRWLFRSERDGDCSDIRRFQISQTGILTVVIGPAPGHEETTGSYSFRASDVTTPPTVPIDGAVVVSPDVPRPSAGRLEAIGHQDRYSFQATADETYVLEQLDCQLTGGDFLVMEVDGAGLSKNVLLSGPTGCSMVERLVPTETGIIEILVRANGDRTTGSYSFVVEPRGAETPVGDLVLGDAADPEATPIISGELSALGEQDQYSFEVKAGQQFVLQQTGECEIVGDDSIWADITGPGFDDTVRFKTLLEGDCRENNWYQADNDGPVELVVRHKNDAATGSYNLRLLLVPVDPILTIFSSQVIAPDTPVVGAGKLSAIGQQDVFRIDVVDDQIVTIELLGGCDFKGNDKIFLDAEGAGINKLMFLDEESEGDCLDKKSYEVEQTGPLFITVSDRSDNLATGSYSFVVTVE